MSSTFKHYNPILKERLAFCVKSGNAELLLQVLSNLRASDFRTAGYMMANDVLMNCDSSTFWHLFINIVPINTKAYLGTFLKAAVSLYQKGLLSLCEQILLQHVKISTAIDKQKVVEAFLPHLRSVDEVKCLVNIYYNDEQEKAVQLLIKAGTLPCYYVMFNLLKSLETDRIAHYIKALLIPDNQLAYNMASVIKQYFDINNIPAAFSLHIEPYQLHRLDKGYETFVKVLTNKSK